MENIVNINYDELAITDLSRFSTRPLPMTDGFIYPAILLKKVYFKDIMHILKTLKKDNPSHRDIPLWVESNDNNGFINVGSLRLDSEFLIIASHLNIGVELYSSEDNVVDLDLDNPNVIANFI